FFEYVSDAPYFRYFSMLSARYAVRADSWNGIGIEVHYHPGHEYNVERMIQGIKDTFEYLTKNLGPYPHKQIRIVEFPRYERFAQSFPTTIPYSESVGFIAKVDENDEKDVDYPYYITA